MVDATADGASNSTGIEDKKKSKKPADSAFKQQRLPAWQPVMTAKTVIPTFFVISAIFVPLGAFLYLAADGVKEHVLDYTDCLNCSNILNTSSDTPCECNVTFTLKVAFPKPVFMYYGLDNFYQNHRRYVKSRDDTQLLGGDKAITADKLNPDCDPFRQPDASNNSIVYAPCGAIANSMFNDSLWLMLNGTVVPLIKTGIAWPTDKNVKFANPTVSPGVHLCNATALSNTRKPPNWRKSVCELDMEDPNNNGYRNEDFIVWMRTAALPNFRKLYRRINHTADFEDGLPAGNYTLRIQYNYPVKDFEGRKKMILSTTSWIGGKNPFLGIAYMVVGCLCFLLGFIFIAIHCKVAHRNDPSLEVNDRTPYQ